MPSDSFTFKFAGREVTMDRVDTNANRDVPLLAVLEILEFWKRKCDSIVDVRIREMLQDQVTTLAKLIKSIPREQ